MWPPTRAEFREWLELARDLAVSDLRGRLQLYPLLRPAVGELIERSRTAAARTAWRRWRRRSLLPDYVAGRVPFARWFCGVAWRECLRRMLLLQDVRACLVALPADQRRLLLWLYLDQLTFAQAALALRTTPAAVRQAARSAYDTLRAQIVRRLGENSDAFPPPPAVAGENF